MDFQTFDDSRKMTINMHCAAMFKHESGERIGERIQEQGKNLRKDDARMKYLQDKNSC